VINLDTDLGLSEFADLKKENIQWQERRTVPILKLPLQECP